MLSTSAMSSASRTGFHNGPSAQSTLAIIVEVRARNMAAAMIGLQLQPWPVAWCSSTLTDVMPWDSPHCANSRAVDSSLLCARGSPCGEAKLKRSTVNSMSGSVGTWRGDGLNERSEVWEQRAVDDLDAGAERVDVVGEHSELRVRYFSGHFEAETVVLQCTRRLDEVVGEVADMVDGITRCGRPRRFRNLLDQFDIWALYGVDDRRGQIANTGGGAERQRIAERGDPPVTGQCAEPGHRVVKIGYHNAGVIEILGLQCKCHSVPFPRRHELCAICRESQALSQKLVVPSNRLSWASLSTSRAPGLSGCTVVTSSARWMECSARFSARCARARVTSASAPASSTMSAPT